MPRKCHTLRLVLGDQLSHNLASLRAADKTCDVILMAEVMAEATYAPHHPKKIALIFAAMRHFAAELQANGFTVRYVKLTDSANTHSLMGEVARAIAELQPQHVVFTFPGEYRVAQDFLAYQQSAPVPVEILEDDRFFCPRAEFAAWAKNRKQLRMEFFYREQRQQHKILLLPDGTPVGGAWNFDAENRKALPKNLRPPAPYKVKPDAITQEVLALIAQKFNHHFGTVDDFWFGTTAADATAALQYFIQHALPQFGDYQDAMQTGEATLFHSVLSIYLNIGLLCPKVTVAAAVAAYESGHAPLNAVEGFVRQVLGWREFIRGIYWLKMPDYAAQNFLGAARNLPAFYWTGETKLNCLKQCISQTRNEAYAHHIQRLMVTGNFALLLGVEPKQINEWYLAVYADAFEWVELPNVHGMVMHADGGVLGSKPYAASGKYIQRMSDYCQNCRYDVNASTGENACPFNYLYWNFIAENKNKLAGNPRMGMMYQQLAKMAPEKVKAMQQHAADFMAAHSAAYDWSKQ